MQSTQRERGRPATAAGQRRWVVFDIETRIDKGLVRAVYCPGESLSDEAGYERARIEIEAESGGRGYFFPVAFHVPISIVVADVGTDYALRSVRLVAEESYSEEALVRSFWRGVEEFEGILVSFNGRNFDLPVLELQALRYGCAAPKHFNERYGRRYRYSEEGHYDLYEFLTNTGAYRVRGGLNLLARLVGLPGKTGVEGSQVQALWEAGRLEEIHRYCRHDVIQTYFLFLRVELMRGRIPPERYAALLDAAAPYRRELEG